MYAHDYSRAYILTPVSDTGLLLNFGGSRCYLDEARVLYHYYGNVAMIYSIRHVMIDIHVVLENVLGYV